MDERRPYGAWAASGTLHGAILALILLGFASAPKFEDSEESIPVETVSDAELNQIMNGEKRAEPAPPPRPAPEVAPAPAAPSPPPPPPDLRASLEPAPTPPPRPQSQPKPEPPPKPAPPPKPLAEEAPEPPMRPRIEPERPKPAPPEKPKQDLIAKVMEREKTEPQPMKAARAYDPSAIAKLLGEAKPASSPTAQGPATAAPQGLPRRNAARMSVSMSAALDAWLTESYLNCWTPPPTMPEGDVYVAEIKVVFNVDGSLSTRPVLLNPPADPAWRAHAESAIRAVRKCDPLRVPPEYIPYFEQWKVETIHFDPRETQG